MLARLGLRAAEVAGLGLDDVDWRAGEIVVRGKGDRVGRLPLPVDVGEALVAYLQHGRPPTACRALFVGVNRPWMGLTASTMAEVVHRACARSGVAPVGAHRLRHSAATAIGGALGAPALVHDRPRSGGGPYPPSTLLRQLEDMVLLILASPSDQVAWATNFYALVGPNANRAVVG